ncbi:putative pentatricopeptide repeat-containing protein At5g37570 [Tripterygium wilfordii]|uniref:putative pentatricopeptide repeat-containing protein At5g37570 n=1 Tax=Tripterygium wilfordii TaxID=458696 RepID=UPI0018F830B2|nr:putative pentatricopeptide repeat-containing protein At5g37570 [Tripterygium wilfordii]XP_038697511.1 putative pentatricopeptide repeat-containing protein At5g37570 [Tripterygium wilfordii]
MPTSLSLPSLLKSCKTKLQLYQLHAHIIREGLEQDHYLVAKLLYLSSSLSYSASIFDRVCSPSTVVYNTLIKSYSCGSYFFRTFSLFILMKRSENARPDKYSYPSVLKACAGEFRVKEGMALHGSAVRCGVNENVFVGSSLVDFYGKCKEISSTRKVFDEMPERNVVSWTSMVVAYVAVGDLAEARRVFDEMPVKNLTTWNAMIGGLVRAGDLVRARKVFDEMSEKNVVSFTTMIDGHAKAGDMVSARVLFEQAPERDIVAWSALISGYVQNDQPNDAIKIFLEMCSRNVKPDEFIMVSLMSACSRLGNLELANWVDDLLSQSSLDLGRVHVKAAMIDMNAKCGKMGRAKEVFEEMPKRDLISYCSMIQGLSIHGRGAEAVKLFGRMLSEGLEPDEIAFTVILTACSHAGLVEEGWYYFETMTNVYGIVPCPDHYACMVDLLSRSGRPNEAYELIKSMPMEPHAGSWGALLWACKLHGDIELGKVVANRLFELEPQNAATYVLLSNIYAAAEQWKDASIVRNKMKEMGVRKMPARSWVSSQESKTEFQIPSFTCTSEVKLTTSKICTSALSF